MNKKNRQIGLLTALLSLVTINFPYPVTAQVLEPILSPVENIFNGGSQQGNFGSDYQALVRQEFDREYQCVTTQQYTKAKYDGFPAGYFTGTVVKHLALRLTPCMLQNGIRFNPVKLLLSVGFTSRNVNDAVVVIVYAGRKSISASNPAPGNGTWGGSGSTGGNNSWGGNGSTSGNGSGKNRPGLPSPVPSVDGTFQIFKSNLPSCQPGNYRIAGSFDSSFTTFTLTQAGGAEGCFSSVPAPIFTAPGLRDGGQPIKFESRVGAGGIRIAGSVSRVYGSFLSPIVYPDVPSTYGVLALNSQNTKVEGTTSIPGNPNDQAIVKMPDKPTPAEVAQPNEISTVDGVEVVRTIIYVHIKESATVDQINALLAATGGSIYSSQPGIPSFTLAIPNTGDIDGLINTEQILATQPAVIFSLRQSIPGVPPIPRPDNPGTLLPATGGNLIPVALFMEGAVDLNGQPPRPFNPNNPVHLFLGDYFNQQGNQDINLKKIYGGFDNTSKGDHGYMVVGWMAARRDNNLGVLGMYPAPNQEIVGFNDNLKAFDAFVLDHLSRLLTKPTRKKGELIPRLEPTGAKAVINFSLGACGNRTPPCLSDNEALSQGTGWLREIRKRNLEENLVIAASAGNGGSTTNASRNFPYQAAALRSDLTQVVTKTERECGGFWSRVGGLISRADPCKDVERSMDVPTDPLKNTLVAEALDAQTGDYTNYSTRGGNVRAIIDVDGGRIKRTVFLTNGDRWCSNTPPPAPGTSLFGRGLPILAPNNQLRCITNTGGTSSAAPQVAGLAAYLWNQEPNLKASEVVQRIINNQTTFQKLDTTGNLQVDASGNPVMSIQNAINVRKTLGLTGLPLTGERPTPPSNRPPVANNDAATVSRYGSIRINVLANDTDPDGDSLSVISLTPTPGSQGSITLDDGLILYSPSPSSSTSTDTFTYTISDGKGGTATATVTITIK